MKHESSTTTLLPESILDARDIHSRLTSGNVVQESEQNVFCDPSLRTDDNILLNLVRIIRSGRVQGFEKLVIRVPKTYLEYYVKIARQLMVIERVVIENTEDSDDVVYHIYFPDIIWIESAYWEPRSRTNLHPRHLTKDQLDKIKAMFDLHKTSDDERRLLLKAIDLDERFLDEE